jgi:hypothetical protein
VDVSDRLLDAHLFLRAVCFRAVKVLRGDDGDQYRFVRNIKVADILKEGGRPWS